MWGATQWISTYNIAPSFNSRTPCGVRRSHAPTHHRQPAVSIHAPRVGCDKETQTKIPATSSFNSRTPCGVRPTSARTFVDNLIKFQFTHPVWGATPEIILSNIWSVVSIHAPRVGCDSALGYQEIESRVSIHAPRVGCDFASNFSSLGSSSFNSRTPCGVRLRTI